MWIPCFFHQFCWIWCLLRRRVELRTTNKNHLRIILYKQKTDMFQDIFHHDDTSDGQNAKLHSSLQLPLPLGRCWWLESNKHRQASTLEQKCEVVDIETLLGTNISPTKAVLKMISLFPRLDMLVPWRVCIFSTFWYAFDFDGFRNLAITTWNLIKPCKTR